MRAFSHGITGATVAKLEDVLTRGWIEATTTRILHLKEQRDLWVSMTQAELVCIILAIHRSSVLF